MEIDCRKRCQWGFGKCVVGAFMFAFIAFGLCEFKVCKGSLQGDTFRETVYATNSGSESMEILSASDHDQTTEKIVRRSSGPQLDPVSVFWSIRVNGLSVKLTALCNRD